jgi:hypothetical protein
MELTRALPATRLYYHRPDRLAERVSKFQTAAARRSGDQGGQVHLASDAAWPAAPSGTTLAPGAARDRPTPLANFLRSLAPPDQAAELVRDKLTKMAPGSCATAVMCASNRARRCSPTSCAGSTVCENRP